MLNPDDFKQAIKFIDALGATPAVLVEVAELAKDPNTDIETMCALLRNDGSLAADIIRISNSPFYAPAAVHSNLNSAINYIGLREVNRVVNLSLARQLFARDLCSYGLSAYDYWSDSVATALLMEALAEESDLNPQDACTIGILHAIGRVVIDRVIEQKGFSIYWDGAQPIHDWERNAVGFDYAQAGAMLLEHWRFPAATCEIIRAQLDSAKVSEPVSMLGLLRVAQRLIALAGSSFENVGWGLSDADDFLQAAQLPPAEVLKLVAKCREDFQKILETVDVKPSGARGL